MFRKKQSLFCLHCFVNTSDCISSIQNLFQFFVIVKRSLFLLWLSNEVYFLCDWANKSLLVWLNIEVSWSCSWALRSLLLCVWATCNLIFHFSGTLLGSARGTWLLPVCGRNLYNCLCSFFLCFLTFIRCTKTLNSSQTLNLGTVFQNVRKKSFFKNTIQPPLLVVFLTFSWYQSFGSVVST